MSPMEQSIEGLKVCGWEASTWPTRTLWGCGVYFGCSYGNLLRHTLRPSDEDFERRKFRHKRPISLKSSAEIQARKC
jgi:hypothetical protein